MVRRLSSVFCGHLAFFLFGIFTTTCLTVAAQDMEGADQSLSQSNYENLIRYAASVGIQTQNHDNLNPERHALTLLFELTYGHSSGLSYQGVKEVKDSARIKMAYRRLLAGEDPQSVAVTLEPADTRYCSLVESFRYVLDDTETGKLLTINDRRQRLAASLNTYRWLNRFPDTDKIIINIPATQLWAFTAAGEDVMTMNVILGKPDTPTPTMTSYLSGVVMFPYWYVPKSIATKELLPKIRRNPAAVLEGLRMQVLNAQGHVLNPNQINWHKLGKGNFPYYLRQSTGCDNALGVLKFTINTPFNVYLHDTNQRQLFARTNRYLSHGCIRVEKPIDLANWVLRNRKLTQSQLQCRISEQKPATLPVRANVAVFVLYRLVDADADGCLTWHNNIYNKN